MTNNGALRFLVARRRCLWEDNAMAHLELVRLSSLNCLPSRPTHRVGVNVSMSILPPGHPLRSTTTLYLIDTWKLSLYRPFQIDPLEKVFRKGSHNSS